MGGSVNNMAAAPNFRGIDAPVDPSMMQFAKQQFAGDDMSGRNAYQSELVNQLRGNTYQSPESVWGAVQAQQAQAQQSQQSQKMQELNNFIATAPGYSGQAQSSQPFQGPTGQPVQEELPGTVWAPVLDNGNNEGASLTFGTPLTVEQLRATGEAPAQEGEWLRYFPGGGDDVGYYEPWSWSNVDGGGP